MNTEKSKTAFELVAELTTSTERMQMQQLGLNPFREGDIEEFKNIQSVGKIFNFFPRLKAAFSILFRSKVTLDLEVFVLRNFNDGKDNKDKTFGLNLKPISSGIADSERIMKNVNEDFVKKVDSISVSKNPKIDQEYKDKLTKELSKRRVDTTPAEFDQTTHLEAGFIPGPIPTIIEPAPSHEPIRTNGYSHVEGTIRNEGVLTTTTISGDKPKYVRPSKRKKITGEPGTPIKGVHRDQVLQ